MESLGEEYPKLQAHVRELLSNYEEIGTAGMFGAIMLKDVLKRADEAAISGDVVAMIAMYKEMEGCE